MIDTDALTPEKAAQFKRLYNAYFEAIARATVILKDEGMLSDAFKAADAAAGELWVRLRELQGMGGKHWMA